MTLKRVLQIYRDSDEPKSYGLETPLKDGEQGNLQTLAVMAEIVREDRKHRDLRRFVLREIIGAGVASHDEETIIKKIFDYAQNKIIYRNDPVGVERVADIWSTIYGLNPDEPEGDCGIKSTFLASCLAIMGKRTCFVVMRDDPQYNNFNHVYVGLLLPSNNYVSLDPTPTDKALGWEAPALHRATYQIF